MKTITVCLLSVLVLFGSLVSGSAQAFIAVDQSVNFDDGRFFYWAFIWDYTNRIRESATVGFVDVDTTLNYKIISFGERHVAYLYDVASGEYIEALALRDILL